MRSVYGGLEFHGDATQAKLVAIVDGRWRLRGQLLFVHEGEVGAVLIFDHILVALQENLGMQPRDAALLATMSGQVNIGIDVADGILASDQNLALAGKIERLPIRLDDELGRGRGSGGRR